MLKTAKVMFSMFGFTRKVSIRSLLPLTFIHRRRVIFSLWLDNKSNCNYSCITNGGKKKSTLQKRIMWQGYKGRWEQLLPPEHNRICSLWTNVPQHAVFCYINSSSIHTLWNLSNTYIPTTLLSSLLLILLILCRHRKHELILARTDAGLPNDVMQTAGKKPGSSSFCNSFFSQFSSPHFKQSFIKHS